MKRGLLLSVFGVYAFAQNPQVLQYTGVKTVHNQQAVTIERQIPRECLDVHILPEDIFSGNLAGKNVPALCQKSVVTTVGKIQPMQLDPKIITVGEVEVLEFIQHKLTPHPDRYVLVDARKQEWFEQMSIPGSVNLPFDEVAYDADFPEDFEHMKNVLGIVSHEGKLDFSHAKTALIFCNASWCAQSHMMIDQLVKMGYPKEKILWYRGGLQDWLLFGFSVISKK
ncbi:rhodanese-like domain-containing protein [Sulfurospirillum barnesii]|uniref:Rhodanese-related sulfurtransferase n=1 Tax=Sulfurospirillum barnesii (strain ATCC 700032 / DSM 10660 / SES-3) TaxID=760154 RepID=I3XZ97_SULBS|nr:rhodanese-like domain-containing protein [Sulfurospirillum barnesii]AFL69271.1 Rhodanese-related sulfurtransferase [Sulfurospirillum barnesii SES-3]